MKGFKEPASVIAWNVAPLGGLYVAAVSIALYARFIRGYNNLWLVAGFAPFWTYVLYNYYRQPNQAVQNSYQYLLARRAATCELQANSKKFNEQEFAQSEQFRKIRAALETRNITLYELEAEIVDKINAGSFK